MTTVTPDPTGSLLRTQYAVANALADSKTLKAGATRMLEAVCQGLDWDIGEIWLLDTRNDALTRRYMWAKPGVDQMVLNSKEWNATFRKGEGIPGKVWESGEPLWIADVTADQQFIRADAVRALGLRAGFGYPIEQVDGIPGVIEFFSVTKRDVDEEILDATKLLGRQFGSFLWRTRTRSAVRASERRARLALEAGHLGDWQWDMETNEVSWSEALETIHGLAPGTFKGTFEAYLEDVHPEDRDMVIETIQRSVETGTHELEYRILTPGGQLRWLSARGEVERDGDGTPIRMVGVCSDDTERKQREERQRFLSKASASLVKTLDPDEILQELADLIVGSISDWCAIDLYDGARIQRAVLAHRDPAKEDLANRLRKFIHDPAAIKDVLELMTRGESLLYRDLDESALAGAAMDEEHLALMKKLGFHSAMIVPMRARGRLIGGITFICGEESQNRNYSPDDLELAEDLAGRAAFALDNARLYQEAEETQELLRKANEFKDEFVGFVSHELRTPLTTVLGGARLLSARGDRLDEKSRDAMIKDIETEAQRLHRLVEDLLVLARPEQHEESFQAEPLQLEKLVSRVIGRVRRRNSEKFVVEAANGSGLALGDSTYTEQIVRNLLSNAEKFSPAEEPIHITIERDGEFMLTSVLDRGPGVPGEELERIFQRFYRRSGKAKGVGLGLAVCKRLTEIQGGRIWAEPREEGGLKVSFTLPAHEHAGEE